jgi:NADH-quinone oxidoreductase subunit K
MGAAGVIARRNLLVIYLSIELMLNAANLMLALFSRVAGDGDGGVIALLNIGVIAAEASLFLAMTVHLYRLGKSLDSWNIRSEDERGEP